MSFATISRLRRPVKTFSRPRWYRLQLWVCTFILYFLFFILWLFKQSCALEQRGICRHLDSRRTGLVDWWNVAFIEEWTVEGFVVAFISTYMLKWWCPDNVYFFNVGITLVGITPSFLQRPPRTNAFFFFLFFVFFFPLPAHLSVTPSQRANTQQSLEYVS